MAQKRINKEMSDIKEKPFENWSVEHKDDIMLWHAVINGPSDTPYETGQFFLDINFPSDYPFKPVKCKFNTKIYHPNIGEHGDIKLELLKGDWDPSCTVAKVMETIVALMVKPDLENAYDSESTATLKKDKENFDQMAREWTERFAS